jgi:hypothetical protein
LDSDRLLLQGDGLEVLTVKTGERSQIQAGVESGVIYDVQWATFDNKRTALIAEHDQINESAGLFLDAKTLSVSQAFPDGRLAVQTRFVGNRLVRTEPSAPNENYRLPVEANWHRLDPVRTRNKYPNPQGTYPLWVELDGFAQCLTRSGDTDGSTLSMQPCGDVSPNQVWE